MAHRSRMIATVTVAIFLTITASACSTAGDGGLTLVQTKSPVQLLRNNAVDRVAPAAIEKLRKEADASFPCGNEDENPGGLVRQWQSSVDVVLAAGHDRAEVADGLIASFVDEGWAVNRLDGGSTFALSILSSESSVAQIQIAAADETANSIVRITAIGPCVTTAGPDSDEVASLD